jgi:hypothetical protein
MMMNKRFLRGIPALLLVFVLIFAACENGLTEVGGTVGISAVEAPNLTATLVKGGVLLEWDSVLEATNYAVWRKTGDTAPIQLGGSSLTLDRETGKYRYTDLVSDTNELRANTAYTYIVFSSGGGAKTQGRAEATATPADIPAKGTKLDAVSGVTLELDYEANEAKVSWTIPDGAIPAEYVVRLYRDGNPVIGDSVSLGQKSVTFNSNNGFSLQDGNYEARVYARSGGNYFEDGPVAASAKQKFEALFGNRSLSAGINSYHTDTNGVIDRLYVYLDISGIGKPGVGYTFQRAEADELGNVVGTYAGISVYQNAGDTTALTLTADILGNLQNPVYDNSLPAVHGKSYKYRIIATKGSATQEREFSNSVKVDLRDYAYLSVNITGPTQSGTTPNFMQTYSVTPSLSGVKNALQTGDKLVFYYVKGTNSWYSNIYQNGPYTKSIEFSKAELEAGTAKDLAIPKVDGTDTDAYVVVRLEYADGSWGRLANDYPSAGNVTGSVSGHTNINDGNDYVYSLSSY